MSNITGLYLVFVSAVVLTPHSRLHAASRMVCQASQGDHTSAQYGQLETRTKHIEVHLESLANSYSRETLVWQGCTDSSTYTVVSKVRIAEIAVKSGHGLYTHSALFNLLHEIYSSCPKAVSLLSSLEQPLKDPFAAPKWTARGGRQSSERVTEYRICCEMYMSLRYAARSRQNLCCCAACRPENACASTDDHFYLRVSLTAYKMCEMAKNEPFTVQTLEGDQRSVPARRNSCGRWQSRCLWRATQL